MDSRVMLAWQAVRICATFCHSIDLGTAMLYTLNLPPGNLLALQYQVDLALHTVDGTGLHGSN